MALRWPVFVVSLLALSDAQRSPRRRFAPTPPPPPPGPTPPANTSNVWPQDRCQGATPSADWPSFSSADELRADSQWSHYFQQVYGDIPERGYPICSSSLTWIYSEAMATSVGHTAQQCSGEVGSDFAYVNSMSACCDPGTQVATFVWNADNIGWAIPSNMWVEVHHLYFRGDKGHAWYYISQGSAVWLFTGVTKVYKDHPDGVLDLLGYEECHDSPYHTEKPATECENDFDELMAAGVAAGYESMQFTNHYDCNCGTLGPSSWTHKSWCQTEIIDLTGEAGSSGSGCAYSKFNLRAGWNAQAVCSCDHSKNYVNCEGYGLAGTELL